MDAKELSRLIKTDPEVRRAILASIEDAQLEMIRHVVRRELDLRGLREERDVD